jgi:hypothetical protein
VAKNDELEIDEIDDDAPDAPKQLRDAYKRAEKRAAEAEAQAKRVPFLEAGLDTSTPLAQGFMATYQGDLKADVIREAAEQFHPDLLKPRGTLAGPDGQPVATTSTEGEPVTTTAAPETGTAARQALADGATPSDAAVQDVRQHSLDTAREALAEGKRWRQAVGAAVNERARGVAEGTFPAVDAFGNPVTLRQ